MLVGDECNRVPPSCGFYIWGRQRSYRLCRTQEGLNFPQAFLTGCESLRTPAGGTGGQRAPGEAAAGPGRRQSASKRAGDRQLGEHGEGGMSDLGSGREG